ncbi:hypothetical protein W97_02895 [Coniosporium apollinis CBS 100218]|uniref:Uncharacterized protein n=1 Tax=Coniosporium apollinis (strain CBS 100218) TaxID=1168221 RepID=R7YP48_CONA1|nr:uncharacterized protein W97_02895 [Coniosporium apollinis CBS 100218]EON63667.1 hypothetical protein W97_02895 [Coniosporium apollinis CBS 100218]
METVSPAAHEPASILSSFQSRDAGAAGRATYPTISTSNERIKSENKLSQVHQQPLPNSQESYVSTSSSTSAPRLQSSLSDLSNPSIPETALTSPTASDHSQSQSETPQKSQLAEKPASSERQKQPRARTPNIDIAAANAKRDSVNSTQTSPMSIDTPGLTHGSKRTASGLVKPAMPDTPASPVTATPCKHSRTTSLDSNNGHRIGELSAQLKTRLTYAMLKVQHGWENRTLDELEVATSQHTSPLLSTPGAGRSQHNSDSPRARLPSAVSDTSDQPFFSPGSYTSRRSSVSHAHSGGPSYHASTALHAATGTLYSPSSSAPALAPAPDFTSGPRSRRSNPTRVPPMLSSLQYPTPQPSRLAEPRTPTSVPRQGILRMPSQQAEKDAVDSLLFMSSPQNSAYLAHTASAQPSPLRTEFGGRRVVFEGREGGEGFRGGGR